MARNRCLSTAHDVSPMSNACQRLQAQIVAVWPLSFIWPLNFEFLGCPLYQSFSCATLRKKHRPLKSATGYDQIVSADGTEGNGLLEPINSRELAGLPFTPCRLRARAYRVRQLKNRFSHPGFIAPSRRSEPAVVDKTPGNGAVKGPP